MSFNPDVRNLGGRKILVDQIYNHYISLSKIKSTLNTLEFRPSLAKKVNPSESRVVLKNASDQKNAFALKTRVQSAKKQIDSREPVSFNQIRKGQPCGASSKQFQFIMGEHFKNLLSQKSRIGSQNSMSERKKNFYDSTAYPAKFFRRVDEFSLKSSSVSSASSKQHRKGVKSAQLATRNQDIGSDFQNNEQEQNYYYNSSPSPTAVKKQQKVETRLLSSVKKGNYSLNSSSTKHLANSTQAVTVTSQLLRASPTSSSKQYSQLLNRSISNTLHRLSPSVSTSFNTQQQQQLFIQIKQQQKQQFRLSADRKQPSLTQEEEEQRWSRIVEEIPVLLDLNENSINLLKEHLVNLIIEFRLYRGADYEAMKNIFEKKNPQIDVQLSSSIFEEIVNALNE